MKNQKNEDLNSDQEFNRSEESEPLSKDKPKSEDVYFDEAHQVTVANFKGYLTLAEFQSVANSVQDLRSQKSPKYQLAILEDLDVLSTEILDWIKAVWFPIAIESGLKYFGFIVPKSQLATMSVKLANKEADRNSPIQIEYFRTLAGALEWIKRVKENNT